MNVTDSFHDSRAVIWALSWTADLVGAEIRSAVRVRSNEINQVVRLCFDSGVYFLKIGPDLRREHQRLQWLGGRLPAPHPLGLTTQGPVDALVMSAVEGEDLPNLAASLPAQVVVERMALALKAVHATPIVDWPFGGTGTGLVHGDACLPNFLYLGDQMSGCIDVGDMAVGDPEIDLAAAVWSLQYNIGAGHGLAFLRAYGLNAVDEELVERLRLSYKTGCV